MKQTETIQMFQVEGDVRGYSDKALIKEEPLSIRIEGRPYAVVMRTPGDEIAHAAGFCLAEGIVDSADDLATIGFCREADGNVVTATLTPERRRKVGDKLERKGFVSQTSCGICGKELIKDISRILERVPSSMVRGIESIPESVHKLKTGQQLYGQTGGAHGAMVLDEDLAPLAFAEDVGRHNALDKAIGTVLMAGQIENARIAVMSSRLSYELVQKAGRAGIQMLIGLSSPTSLAVELGRQLNMTPCHMRQKGRGFCLLRAGAVADPGVTGVRPPVSFEKADDTAFQPNRLPVEGTRGLLVSRKNRKGRFLQEGMRP